MKDSFIFYRSFFEAIKDLDDKKRLKMFDSITKFALENEENENLNGVCKQLFVLIKPQILANNVKMEQYERDIENGKKGAKYGKLGGRPSKDKQDLKPPQKTPPGFLKNIPPKNPINVNENVNENVNVNENENENENENFNVVEETTSPPAESLLLNWYGEYQNVHLTEEQYNLLKCNVVGDKKVLDGLIDELSSNIAQKNPKAPPYDEEYPDMHFSKIKAYWNYRKLHGFKPPDTKEDKAQKFKDELAALTEKYRAKELDSG